MTMNYICGCGFHTEIPEIFEAHIAEHIEYCAWIAGTK